MVKPIRTSLHSMLISLILLASSTFAATITLPRTGQIICYDVSGAAIPCTGTGQDGNNLKGAAWPTPRFVDNVNGTVTDKLTGLIWLKNANCFGNETWEAALTSVNVLANGLCGLSDGSVAGKWRLPNRKELISLVDRSVYPVLPTNLPFTSVQNNGYWSSSSIPGYTIDNLKDEHYYAWGVSLSSGTVSRYDKGSNYYVWPVCGGQ